MEQRRMQNRTTVRRRPGYRQWKRRKTLRLARNWAIFLAGCGLVVFLLTKGILWLLPKITAVLYGPKVFAAEPYDTASYLFDETDERLLIVNGNKPYTEEPQPLLSQADENGNMLEAEAAMQYRSMAAAAQADGVTLILVQGYQDAEQRQQGYQALEQDYQKKHKSQQEAAALAASIEPEADCNEHGTGYAADILCKGYETMDTGFEETKAFEWLSVYAAEYGFILRYPQASQAVTGVVYEPWHWRYVGRENALAIRESGLSLEEFVALQKAAQ